jgi:hypothetical protein
MWPRSRSYVLSAIVLAALAFPSAASACAVTTPAAVAGALHLESAAEPTLLLTPGPAWSVQSSCTIEAWSGARPTTGHGVEAAIAAGTFAVVSIGGWAPATGLFPAGAQLMGFQETLASVKHEARARVVGKLHGEAFGPRPHGAQAVGWRATSGSAHVAIAVWSKRRSLRILEIAVRESRKRAATVALERVAAAAVPAFGL